MKTKFKNFKGALNKDEILVFLLSRWLQSFCILIKTTFEWERIITKFDHRQKSWESLAKLLLNPFLKMNVSLSFQFCSQINLSCHMWNIIFSLDFFKIEKKQHFWWILVFKSSDSTYLIWMQKFGSKRTSKIFFLKTKMKALETIIKFWRKFKLSNKFKFKWRTIIIF